MKNRTKRMLVLIGAVTIATAGIVMCAPSTTHALLGWDRINEMIDGVNDDQVGGDLDDDGVLNENDNCMRDANSNQEDFDCDGEGNACDSDIDNDGVANDADACDSDPDDAITDIEVGEDGCPIAPDEPADVSDTDGDGVANELDNCPDAFNDGQADGDGDGIGDACDDSAAFPAGGPGGGAGPGGTNPFAGPGGPITGANMTAESECALMETAAFNPALFILLGAALLPIVRSRRR